MVNPADVRPRAAKALRPTPWTAVVGAEFKSQRAERHLYAGQRIVGDAFLDKIEELDNQRHDPSEESAQVSTSVFRHRDSAGVSHSVFQLVEALFRLVEGDRDAHPERPSGLDIHIRHLEELRRQKLEMTRALRTLAKTDRFREPLRLIMSVPGFGQATEWRSSPRYAT